MRKNGAISVSQRAISTPAFAIGSAILFGAMILLASANAFGWTNWVPDDYPTLEDAINATVDGDTVGVREGVHYASFIEFGGKAITVRSADPQDANVVSATIVDGCGVYSLVLNRNENSGCVLWGLTFTNGGVDAQAQSPLIKNCYFRDNNLNRYEGALRISLGSPMVQHCRFSNNNGAQYGSAVYSDGGQPTFNDCLFEVNDARVGGALYLKGDAILQRCNFRFNTAQDGGGGIRAVNGDLVMFRCSFYGNSSQYRGGAVEMYYANPNMTNCSFLFNRATTGGAIYATDEFDVVNSLFALNSATESGGAIYADIVGTVTLENCTVADNTTETAWEYDIDGNSPSAYVRVHNSILRGAWVVNKYVLRARYSNIEGGVRGQGNIDEEPNFVAYDGFDYVLAPSSPCVDAGDPTIEDGIYDSHPSWPEWYPNGSRSDMGAYGGPGNAGWLGK